ncbi:MAG: fused MFS/spermidine synthase [Planctomycetota bacterium]
MPTVVMANETRGSRAVRAGLSAVFFVSGAAALVYEILWSRQFVTVFGNSAYAISIVLCAFMAGLGAGSLFFGRRADRTPDPLRMYALLEIGIAVAALLIPLLLDLLRASTPRLFAVLSPDVFAVSAVRFVFTFLVLFVPCSLIGGTLPVLARFIVEARGVVGQRIGLLYGLNTLGGAFGCFLAGYHLIERYGIARTGHLAIGANLAIALAALAIRRAQGSPRRAVAASDAPAPASSAPPDESGTASRERNAPGILLFVGFLSGFTTLAGEVLWARLLSLVCPTSPYVFTSILGLFLVGLAVGSLIYRAFLARLEGRMRLLGIVLQGTAASVVGTLLAGSVYIAASGPDAPRRIAGPAHERLLPWSLLAGLIFVLLPTLIMGIVFPLVCAAYTRSLGRVGRSIGLVYGLNTAGCVVGSLAPVFVLVPTIGIQNGLLALALLNAAVGAWVLARAGPPKPFRVLSSRAIAGALVLLLLAAVAVFSPRDLARRLFLAAAPGIGPQNEIVHFGEGRTGTAVVVRDKIDGLYDLYVNSFGEVATTYNGQGVFRLMGHLGPLLHPDPREVLVICFGGGIAPGAVQLHSTVQALDVVDIEGSVIEAARALARWNNRVHESPKLTTHVEDGRNFLLTCGRRYPVIVCDSTHPRAADSWVLYTREYYDLVAAVLEENGLFVQWLPYHGLSQTEYKIILRTLLGVFPQTSLWMVFGPNERGAATGYTLLVSARADFAIDMEILARRLAEPPIRADLARFRMHTPLKLLRHFVCGPETLLAWTEGVPTNTDDLPFTQYQTDHSEGPTCNHAMFGPLLESPWPYLRNPDPAEEGGRLAERLETCLAARRQAMYGYWDEARKLLPEDDLTRLWDENRRKARRWTRERQELAGGR